MDRRNASLATLVWLVFFGSSLSPDHRPSPSTWASASPALQSHCFYQDLSTDTPISVPGGGALDYLQEQPRWVAAGVRPLPSEDWNIALYGQTSPFGNCVDALRASSARASGVDFVVGDYHDAPLPDGDYPFTSVAVGGSSAQVEYQQSSTLTLGVGAGGSFSTGEVLDVFEVHLQQGHHYTVTLVPTFMLNAKLSLYYNPTGSPYFAGRDARVFEMAVGTTNYTAPATDDYGLVIVNDAAASGTYTITVSEVCNYAQLAVATPTSSDGTLLYIDQSAAKWTAVALKSNPGDNWNLGVLADARPAMCAGAPLAVSTRPAGLDLVVGDFNHMPPGRVYVQQDVIGAASNATVEWDGRTSLGVDQGGVSETLAATDIVRVWDVILVAGRTYDFRLLVGEGDVKILLFRNTSGSAYWANRTGAEFEASATQQYTAPATGTYGLVLINESGAQARYSLGVTGCPPVQTLNLNPTIVPAPGAHLRVNFGTTWFMFTAANNPASNWRLDAYSSLAAPPSSNCFANPVSSGVATGAVDFWVADLRTSAGPHYFDVQATSWAAAPVHIGYKVASTLEVGAPQSMFGPDLRRVYLHAGTEYSFRTTPATPLFLFGNPGSSEYWASRNDSIPMQRRNGVRYYTPTQSDWFVIATGSPVGVVLTVDACDWQSLTPGVTQTGTSGGTEPRAHYFTCAPTTAHWSAVTVITTGAGGNPWAGIFLPQQTEPACVTGFPLVETSGFPFLAAGNLGPGGLPSNGFNVKVTDPAPGPGYRLEWDQATTALQVNGPTITVPANSPGMIDVYDLTLIGGTTYSFYFSGDGGLTRLNVFRSNGWTTTPMAEWYGSFAITAPASETYGVVVWRALSPGGYSLQVTDTPFLMGHEDTPGSAGGVAMGGPGSSPNKSAPDRGSSSATYAYVADGSGGLARIDVHNSRAPFFDTAADVPGAVDLAVTGDLAAVAASAGLHTVDLQAMQDRALVSFPNCTGVAPWGTHQVIVGKPQGVGAIGLVDWTQPLSPSLLLVRETGGDALRVVLWGPKVYVADGAAGFATTDIEDFGDPGSPINHIALPGPALDVDYGNGYVYVACGTAGVFVVDVQNDYAVVGSYDTAGEATGVTVAGNRVYVADGSLGLVVLNITNPASPGLVTTIDTPGTASGVAVVDGMVYLADGSNGLDIVAPEISATDTPDPDPAPAVASFARLRAWPNPLKDRTTLEYALGREEHVVVEIFDVSGRLVRRIFDGTQTAGLHSVAWDGMSTSGARVAAGVYTARLRRPGGELFRRIVVLR